MAGEPGLAAVYVYGSALRDPRYRDVDVALLVRPSKRRPPASRLEAIALELDKAFAAETDLHLLDELPDPIRHRVIRGGVRVMTLDRLAGQKRPWLRGAPALARFRAAAARWTR